MAEDLDVEAMLEAPYRKDKMVLTDASTPLEVCTDIETSSIEDAFEHTPTENEERLPKKLKFKCPVENCDAAFRKNWLLEDHIRKHNKERPFVCTVPECSKSFTKEPHLKRHKVMVHERSCEQICDVKGCLKSFNNKYSLKKHKTKVHSETSHSFFCAECATGFNKKWKLNQHMFIHTGEPPFKCNQCNLGFTLSRDLSKHNRNHKTYTCDCGDSFEKWSLLRRHKKDTCKHIVKNCKNCGKAFTRKDNLHSHYKVCHSDNGNKFQCPYLDCKRTYLYKRNLNWHVNTIHNKEKVEEAVFECVAEGCEKVFSKNCFLTRHLKSAHDDNPKPKKPRAPRKDKGKSKTYMAATLSGIKLTQKEHVELLKGNTSLLTEISDSMLETQLNVTTENSINICLETCTNVDESVQCEVNANEDGSKAELK